MPADRTPSRAGGSGGGEYLPGASVSLWHPQLGWQDGIVHAVDDNHIGVSWKRAARWKPEWNDATTRDPKRVPALSVRAARSAGDDGAARIIFLAWDEKCGDMLPRHLWSDRLISRAPLEGSPTEQPGASLQPTAAAGREDSIWEGAAMGGGGDHFGRLEVSPATQAGTARLLNRLGESVKLELGSNGRKGNQLDRVLRNEAFQ